MPDVTTKRCPRCGQRTTNLQLEECPYCQVALETEGGAQPAGLTQEQARAVARHVIGSWKLWVVMIVLVAAAAWGVVAISEKVIDSRSREYLKALDEKANDRLRIATGEISKEISSQVESELKRSDIESAIERATKERMNEASNSIWPSLQAFRRSMNAANGQLAKATNELEKLDGDIKAAQRKAAQLQAQAQAVQPAPATIVTRAATAAPVATSNAVPAGSSNAIILTMASQTLSANGSDYILTVFFNKTSSQTSGPVNFFAGTLRQSGAKIVGFGLLSQEPSQPMILNDTKDAAQLSFTVTGGDAPIVAVEVTGPTIVQMTSDALAQDLMLPVAADKLLSPSAAK